MMTDTALFTSMPSFLTDAWWLWLWANYATTILAIPMVVTFILHLFAVFNPNIPTGKIDEVFNQYWPKGKPKDPGAVG